VRLTPPAHRAAGWLRARRTRTFVIGAVALTLIAGLLILGSPLTAGPAPVAVAAPVVAAAATTPPPDPAPEHTITSVDARARTPEEVRRDRQQSVRASRMAAVRQMRTRILTVARKQIGDRYAPGRMGPDAFDCSGFTRYVYKMATGKELPHSSRAQYTKVKRIKKTQAQPGDLVFFFERGAHHVGIYIGKNKMIDAPGVGGRVRVSPITGDWWGRSYTGMGRILPA
jgi:cell wall-associated NlpC family hydrolase